MASLSCYRNRIFLYIDPSSKCHNSRIDLWLGSKKIIADTCTCIMKQAPALDHKAVAMDIKTGSNTRGKGYWKINNSVLNEENYKVLNSKLVVDLLEEYGQDVPKPLLWEFLKLKIKELQFHIVHVDRVLLSRILKI